MQVMMGHYHQLSRNCELVGKLEKTEYQVHVNMCTRWVWEKPTQTTGSFLLKDEKQLATKHSKYSFVMLVLTQKRGNIGTFNY